MDGDMDHPSGLAPSCDADGRFGPEAHRKYGGITMADRLAPAAADQLHLGARHGPDLAASFPAGRMAPVQVEELFGALDRGGQVGQFEDGEAAEDLLGFGERSVHD